MGALPAIWREWRLILWVLTNTDWKNLDREILHIIIDRFNGGPVGIDTIAASIGEERVTIEDAYEPYLIQAGFLHRTQKGRVVSEKAYRHLGLTDNQSKSG